MCFDCSSHADDPRTFVAIHHRRHASSIARQVTARFVRSRPAAVEDAVQHAYAEAWRHLAGGGAIAPLALTAWLRQVAGRAAGQELRRAERCDEPGEMDWPIEAGTLGQVDIRLHLRPLVDRAVRRYGGRDPERYRAALLLRLRDAEETDAGVAARFGLSRNTLGQGRLLVCAGLLHEVQ